MKSVQQLYAEKLRTPEEAVKIVKSGDWVDYSQTSSFPIALDEALAARKDELADVNVHNAISMGPVQVVEQDPENRSFTYNLWHCSKLDRRYRGECNRFVSKHVTNVFLVTTRKQNTWLMTFTRSISRPQVVF